VVNKVTKYLKIEASEEDIGIIQSELHDLLLNLKQQIKELDWYFE